MPKDDAAGPDEALEFGTAADDADEEVVDLLEVVRPGKVAPKSAAADDLDFTADLESMLDTLSAAEKAKAAEEATTPSFPDPTPVDHEVDHNESLDLPDMDDLDAILNSLGADNRQAAEQGSAGNGAHEPEDALVNVDTLPDLDAVPAGANGGQDPRLATPAKGLSPADDDFLDSLLQAGDSAPPPADDLDALLEEAARGDGLAAPASEESAPPAAADAVPELPADDDPDDLFAAALAQASALQEAEQEAPAADPVELMDLPEEALAADSMETAEEAFAAEPPEAPEAPQITDPFEAALAELPEPAPSVSPAGALAADEAASALEDEGAASASAEEELEDAFPEDAALAEALAGPEPAGAADMVSGEAAEEEVADGHPLEQTVEDPLEQAAEEPLEQAAEDFLEQALEEAAAPAAEAPLAEEPAETVQEELDTAVGDIASEALDSEEAMAAGILPEAHAEADDDAPGAEESSPGTRLDEVDLVELDALLDDMLAGAPASGPAPAGAAQAASQEAAPALEPAAAAPGEDSSAAVMISEIASLRRELEVLRGDLNDALALKPAGPELDAGEVKAALDSHDALLAAQGGRIEDMELTIVSRADEEAERADLLRTQEDRIGLLDGRLEALSDGPELIAGLEARLDGLEGRLGTLEEQFADMAANLDKLAAEAAARVIREELAALMAEAPQHE